MTKVLWQTKRILATTAVLAVLFLVVPRVPAEPVPGKQDRLVIQLVCNYLQQGHLSRPEIGDELSRRLFKHFLKDLDPTKLYFVKSDIDEFKKQEIELDDLLHQGDMSFAYKVYERFVARLGERLPLVEEMVNAKHDFTVKENLDTDFDSVEYVKTQDDLRE